MAEMNCVYLNAVTSNRTAEYKSTLTRATGNQQQTITANLVHLQVTALLPPPSSFLLAPFTEWVVRDKFHPLNQPQSQL